MNIIEAVKGVTSEKPYIYRRLWCFPSQEPHDGTILVEPLNTVGGSKMAVVGGITGTGPIGPWPCAAEDLTADDWELYAATKNNAFAELMAEAFKPIQYKPPVGRDTKL